MSIAVNPITVADSIAGLVITGVTMRDIDQIPDSAQDLCPIMFPQPNGFISAVQPETISFGSLGSQAENFTYTLNYVFLYAEIGSGISSYAPYKPLMEALKLVIDKILNSDVVTGLVDMQLESIDGIGAIDDPSGNTYWGALFSLRCLEYAQ